MKKLLLIIILLNCCVAFSQRDYSVVKGNVGEKNVNISIINTNFGVSSDDKGDFMMALPKTEKQVGLLFSCIGYEDTLVSVIPNRDTINLNFKMKETTYMLDAVGVGADKIKRYSEPSYVMYDFEIFDDKVFVLQRKGNTLNECRILVQDLWLDPIDTISIPNHIKPEKLFLDCLDCCQMLGRDSVYQIVREDNTNNYIINYATEIAHYAEVMDKIIFMTPTHVYFKKTMMDGYVAKFYRMRFESKNIETIIVCNDMKSYDMVKDEREYHATHKFFFLGNPSNDDWEEFVKMAWFHPKDSQLYKVQDKIYYFDHLNNKIITYDFDMNQLHECDITYPTEENFWRHRIYKDSGYGRFYTVFGTKLNEININNGKTKPLLNINTFMAEKMVIHKGHLYSVTKRRDALHGFVSYIERIEIN